MVKEQFLDNQTQENEANTIGLRFINSNDVLADMDKTFGVNLKSRIRIHNDEDSFNQLENRDEDAYSQGNDIFFGRGVLNNSPESKGLLAHEATHVMQTQNLGGFSNVGGPSAAQGGFLLNKIKKFFWGDDEEVANPAQGLVRNNKGDLVKPKLIFRDTKEYIKNAAGTREGISGEGLNTFQKATAVPDFSLKSANPNAINVSHSLLNKFFSSTILGSIATSVAKKNAHALKRNWLYRGLHGVGSAASAVGRGIFNLGKLGIGKLSGNKTWSEDASRYLQTGFVKNLSTGAGTIGGGLGGALGGAALGTMIFPGIGTLIGSIAGGALGLGLGHGIGRKVGSGIQKLTYNKGNDSISKRAEEEYNESLSDVEDTSILLKSPIVNNSTKKKIAMDALNNDNLPESEKEKSRVYLEKRSQDDDEEDDIEFD